MRGFLGFGVGLGLAMAQAAAADPLIVGYQLGLTQTFQTVLTNSAQAFLPAPGSEAVVQLTGLQLNLGASANLTLDWIGPRSEQGLLFGVAFNQLIPTLQPATVQPLQRQRTTGVQANASYLARIRWSAASLSLGAGYGLGLNGQLPTDGAGGVGGQTQVSTLPGQQVGFLVLNRLTHSANASALLQLNQARWDSDLELRYAFVSNGIYSLAPTAPAGTTASSALGAFVPATSHTLGPSWTMRERAGQSDVFSQSLGLSWVIPAAVSPNPDGIVQTVLPETLGLNASAGYQHRLGEETFLTAEVRGGLQLRVPTEITVSAGAIGGLPVVDPLTNRPVGLGLDTITYQGLVGLRGIWRALELQYVLSGGVAEPFMFQPGLGLATAGFYRFPSPVIGRPTPVFSVSLLRRFDPIDASLVAGRSIGPGGLNAAAIIQNSLNLTLNWSIALSSRFVLHLLAGGTLSSVRGADPDLVPKNPDANAPAFLAVATDVDSIGATAGATLPLVNLNELHVDAALSYALLLNAPPGDPAAGSPAALLRMTSHSFILSFRGTYGRGPLERARDERRQELDAYNENPQSGSPLTSANLLNQGRSLGEGTRGTEPGAAPETRRDSRQSAVVEDRSRTEATAPKSDGAAVPEAGNRSSADEEEAEKKEAAAKKRTVRAPETPPIPSNP
ncbi:MAG: hypothetical protein U1E65_16065 [Myxococcota bacterium]